MNLHSMGLVTVLLMCVILVMSSRLLVGVRRNARWAPRKLIIYYLMIDEGIDAEYCLYLRLVYRRDEQLWSTLRIPVKEHAGRTRLKVLRNRFYGDEHIKIAASLHILMAKLSVEKKQDVFKLTESVLRLHYYDFISSIKEEG